MGKTKTIAALRAAMQVGAFGLMALVAACGGDGEAPAPAERTDNADYYPIQTGERKVYRMVQNLSDYGQETTYPTRVIQATRDVDGKTYDVVHDTYDGGAYDTLYAIDAKAIRSSDSGGARWLDLVRFPFTVNAPFVQEVGPYDSSDTDRDGKPESVTTRHTNTVKGLTTVETPAGRFTGVLRVHSDIQWTTVQSKTGKTTVSTAERDIWLAPGVGPVRTEWRTPAGYVESWDLLARQTPGQVPQDRTAPTLLGVTYPTHGGEPIVFTFNEPVTASVLAAVTVIDENGDLVKNLSRVAPWDTDGRQVAISPYYWQGGNYTVQIAAGISDIAGNTMAAQADGTFFIDNLRFTAYAMSPMRQTVNVASHDKKLSAYFNNTVDTATLAGVVLREGNTAVPATVTPVEDYGLELEPASTLKPSTRYTIDLTGVKDIDGQAVVNPLDWTFTTGPTVTVRASSATPSRRTAR